MDGNAIAGAEVLYTRIAQAVRNNALWCDTMCTLHGVPGEFHDTLWLNRYPAPRYYPNIVTLAADRDSAEQQAAIQALVAAGLPGGWGVKDSFCSLDLAAHGFQQLFEAMWLWCLPTTSIPSYAMDGLRWTWIQSPQALAQWEIAWAGGPIQATQPRLFLPALLDNPSIGMIACYQGQELVAGAIVNDTNGVVGLSNVFVPTNDSALFWAGCVAMAQDRFPGVPLVGYERGLALAYAQEVGFVALQPLRVWLRLE